MAQEGTASPTVEGAELGPLHSEGVRARPHQPEQGVSRWDGRRRRRQPARRPRRVRRPARAVRLRQDDHAAHDRRPRVPDRGRHPPRRPVARPARAAQAADDHRLPALRPLPAQDRARECRVRPQDARRRQGRTPQGGARCARDGRALGARGPQAERPLRRPAAARRAGARARDEAEGAAPGRAARRSRPPAPATDAGRAAQPPAPARPDVHPRHAQPGGSTLDGRSHRGHERRPHPADRRPAHDRDQAGDGGSSPASWATTTSSADGSRAARATV